MNLEMPFSTLKSFITPVGKFYVRSHHPLPTIGTDSWQLEIEGEVDAPCALSLADLVGMEARTITTTMECAGNGRTFLQPQRAGAQWESGAVGTATWTGVPLSAVLARAGVRPAAQEAILIGADLGAIKEPPRPEGKIHYSRSLPLEKANSDVLLAWAMNGEPLEPAHGFPLRAIVPGWYGMAAVKWLARIVVSREAYQGYYQTIDYTIWERGSKAPGLLPIREMQVKSQIARPGFAEVIPAGQPYRIHGAAWTGGADISRVEVSTDGGNSWNDARLLGEPVADAWRLWEYDWIVPSTPGKTVLMARATDTAGRTQPREHHDDRGSYIIHHWLPIDVVIR